MKRDREKRLLSAILAFVLVFLAGCKSVAEDTRTSSQAHIHNYISTVVKPSYAAEGYTLHTCTACKEEYRDNFTKMPSEIVSAMATKDYLQPFEDFSRARVHNPEFVMVHFTSAVVLAPKDPYNMGIVRSIFEDYKVSVHYIIQRNGEIFCYIPEELVAYHAGYGTWQDDPKYTDNLNNYSIGIELVAMGSQEDMAQYLTAEEYQKLPPELIGYTDAQYAALKCLIEDICARNDIPMDRQHIIGHEEYSPKKTDPGELFDWERLFS